jgi:hypothetical protein
MKDFLQFINEAVGVPENLIETSELVYDRIIQELNSIVPLYTSIGLTCESLKGYIIDFRENFRISNKTFPQIKIRFDIKIDNNLDEIRIEELSHEYSARHGFIKGKGYKLKKFGGTKGTVVVVSLNIPPKTELTDIQEFFVKEKSQIISSISHELKHYFDLLVKPEVNPAKGLDYGAYLNFVSEIFPLYDFIFKLYYFHDIENSVRPSELAGLLKSEGVTKSNFKEFFYKTEIWDQIKGAKEMTYDGIKADMQEYSDEMDELLVENDLVDFYERMIEEGRIKNPLLGKIEIVLHTTFEYIKNLKMKELKKIMKADDVNPLRTRETSKEKFLNSYLQDIQKYDNYEEFYRSEIQKINKESNKLFKKVAGVYSLASDDVSNENTNFLRESVMNSGEWFKKYFG